MQIAGNIVQRLSSLRPSIQEIYNVAGVAGVPGVSLDLHMRAKSSFGIISDTVLLIHLLPLILILSMELDQ